MYYIITAIIFFAIYGSAQISRVDWKKKNICPKILGVPACYIVLLLYILSAISHLFSFQSNIILFYSSVSIVAFLALMGTVKELSGQKICPRSKNGTPLCYYSLALGASLIILKFIS